MVTKRGSEMKSFRSTLIAACFRLSKCRAVCTESSVSFIGRRGSFSAGDCRSYLRQFGCSDFSLPRAYASDEAVPTGKAALARCEFAATTLLTLFLIFLHLRGRGVRFFGVARLARFRADQFANAKNRLLPLAGE